MSKREPFITCLQRTFFWHSPISGSEASASNPPANSVYSTSKTCLCVSTSFRDLWFQTTSCLPGHVIASNIKAWILPMSSYSLYSEHSQCSIQRVHAEAKKHTELRDCIFKIRTMRLCWGSQCRYYETGQDRIFLKLMCYILIGIQIVQACICQN